MGTFLRKLFERYARRLIISGGEGIKQIPNKERVTRMVDNLYKDFKAAGVTDDMIKTEKDIKTLHHQVAEMNNQNIAKQFESIVKPKKSADVLDLTGKKIDTSKPIMGGKNVPEPINLSKYDDDALNALVDEDTKLLAEANKLSEAGENYGRVQEIEARRKEIREILKAAQDIPPSGYDNFKADLALNKQRGRINYEQMEEKLGIKLLGNENLDELIEIEKRIKEGTFPRHQRRYDEAMKVEELKMAKDEYHIPDIIDPEDFAHGGRASSGLNYLLGEDDQNVRVPYGNGSSWDQFQKDKAYKLWQEYQQYLENKEKERETKTLYGRKTGDRSWSNFRSSPRRTNRFWTWRRI